MVNTLCLPIYLKFSMHQHTNLNESKLNKVQACSTSLSYNKYLRGECCADRECHFTFTACISHPAFNKMHIPVKNHDGFSRHFQSTFRPYAQSAYTKYPPAYWHHYTFHSNFNPLSGFILSRYERFAEISTPGFHNAFNALRGA